jgi:hypothetical protein
MPFPPDYSPFEQNPKFGTHTHAMDTRNRKSISNSSHLRGPNRHRGQVRRNQWRSSAVAGSDRGRGHEREERKGGGRERMAPSRGWQRQALASPDLVWMSAPDYHRERGREREEARARDGSGTEKRPSSTDSLRAVSSFHLLSLRTVSSFHLLSLRTVSSFHLPDMGKKKIG